MNSVAAEQFVIDNEILRMAMRVLRGVEVSDETLALEVIDQVGPGGHCRMEEHTRAICGPSSITPRPWWTGRDGRAGLRKGSRTPGNLDEYFGYGVYVGRK